MNLYNDIKQAIYRHEENLHVNNVQESEVRYAIRWVMRDNPEIFWFACQYHFDQDKQTISFNYQFTTESRKHIQKRIDNTIKYGFRVDYVQSLNAYEQVMSVYKWLLYNCHFNYDTRNDQNIYNVFVRGESDSFGYAKAAQYLFKLLGIDSRLVYGRLNKGEKERGHCWNVVYMEGYPYHVDICLGDVSLEKILKKNGIKNFFRIGDLNYNFFCVSTQEIEKVLKIDDTESHPICNKSIAREKVVNISHINVDSPVYASKSSAFSHTTKVIENVIGIFLFPFTLVGRGVCAIKEMVTDALEDSDSLADIIEELSDTFDDSIILSSTLSMVAVAVRNGECEENSKKNDVTQTAIETGNNVYSSIFAPAEVNSKSHMLVQIYLHLLEEAEKVKSFAMESDKNAERRDYSPLQCKLKKGAKVDVLLNIYGETLLMSDKKSMVWQGSFTKCSFDYFVPKDIDVDELSCQAMLTVNEVPVGEMRFITKIVEQPRQQNPKIIAHKYNKVFISYAHKDEAKVKSFHEGLKVAGIEHFFDRAYLKTGDVFPQVIKDYINSADLFVLFWSENAAKSEYVKKERKQALERAFPQVKPQQAAKLSIYPMSIEPRAELPSDMKDNYHFGEI